ncbi:MAG: FAD-linked oxidase C-terminal domain-containing protein [Armatimonadota bacterium]
MADLAELLLQSNRLLIGLGGQFRNTSERTQHELHAAVYEEEWTVGVEGKIASKAQPFSYIDFSNLPERFDLDEQNQTLTVSAHTEFLSILARLGSTKFAIPYHGDRESLGAAYWDEFGASAVDSIGDAMATDWPHVLQSQHGSWRDWVIGAKIMLADGSIVKSGSAVVKSVSGFDLHKLMIGSRHTLGILLEVCLKVVPRESVTIPSIEVNQDLTPAWRIYPQFGRRLNCLKKSGFSLEQFEAEYGIRAWVHDVQAGTFWFESGPTADLPEGMNEGLRTNYWDDEPEIHSPQTEALMRRTKQLFDPTNKLNPGEFGFI